MSTEKMIEITKVLSESMSVLDHFEDIFGQEYPTRVLVEIGGFRSEEEFYDWKEATTKVLLKNVYHHLNWLSAECKRTLDGK